LTVRETDSKPCVRHPGSPAGKPGILLCLLCFSLSGGCSDKEAPEKPTPQNLAELEQRLRDVLDETKTPGAGVVLVSRDDLPWVKGLGDADRAAGKPVTPETRFRIGSATKSLVSLAILKLQEQDQLRLDDRLRDRAPEIAFSNPWEATDPVRLVHLLEHTAGLDDAHLCEFALDGQSLSLREALAFDAPAHVVRWKPGRYFSYSNIGPAMAAYVVEKVSGQRFEDFVQEQLFDTLKMTSAGFFQTGSVERDLAKSYQLDGTTEVPFSHIFVRPSGSVSATPRDMGRLVQLFLNRGVGPRGRLLRSASIERMETPASTLAAQHGVRAGYGLGNYTRAENGFLLHGHNGGIDGFLAEFAYLPEAGVGYFYAINAANPDAYKQIGKLLRVYLTRHLKKQAAPVAERLPDHLERCAGYYEPFTPRQELTRFLDRLMGVVRLDTHEGNLRVTQIGDPPEELIPVTDTTFRSKDDPIATVAFVEDGANGVILEGFTRNLRGNFRPVPAWLVWLEGVTAAVCLVLMVSALLFALVWVPRLLLRRLRGVPHLSVRALPLLAVVCLIGTFIVLAQAGDATVAIDRLGKATPFSIGVCVLTWLFAVATVLGLVQALRAGRLGVRRSVRIHSLLVAAANVVVLAYLAYWGIIGLRTWA
jgi:CubicO group peptidase (beta-lactamase class C family)